MKQIRKSYGSRLYSNGNGSKSLANKCVMAPNISRRNLILFPFYALRSIKTQALARLQRRFDVLTFCRTAMSTLFSTLEGTLAEGVEAGY